MFLLFFLVLPLFTQICQFVTRIYPSYPWHYATLSGGDKRPRWCNQRVWKGEVEQVPSRLRSEVPTAAALSASQKLCSRSWAACSYNQADATIATGERGQIWRKPTFASSAQQKLHSHSSMSCQLIQSWGNLRDAIKMKKRRKKTWDTGVGESPESQFHVFPVFIQVGPKKTFYVWGNTFWDIIILRSFNWFWKVSNMSSS